MSGIFGGAEGKRTEGNNTTTIRNRPSFASEYGVKLEFSEKPVYKHAPCQTFNGKEAAPVRDEVEKLLDKGVIVGSSHEPDKFISNIFLRKKDGTYRMILNLKQLNEFIVYRHFKMDSLQAATEP
ncbi:Hypothetical predicted protein [Paramuricea clavata]|uniref:Uncharacterized protein n=1 Tax=Paramuricea clavata TaxID=317549 RepID=A0A6S7IHG8_PARCT|nr:Hypothetical predicted protein [Paramuricea clavata]